MVVFSFDWKFILSWLPNMRMIKKLIISQLYNEYTNHFIVVYCWKFVQDKKK